MKNSDPEDDKPDKHLEGNGHAHHQFNPKRAMEFRDPDRLKTLKLDKLADALDVQTDDHLLDLGTGSGALLPFFSNRLTDGVVLGADVSAEMLSMANAYVRKNGLKNVVLFQNRPDELPLYDTSVNTVLIVSSLHEFSDPVAMLESVNRVLVDGGSLGVIEWRHEETSSGPPLDHRLAPETIDGWFKQTGFTSRKPLKWTDGGYDLYVSQKD